MPAEPKAEFDRVLATVLFTDIVGSTERAAPMGDHAWKELLERHHQVVRALLRRYRGEEVTTAGVGFFATFDGPGRAVRCATSIPTAMEPLGLQIRAGLHTGEIERMGDNVGGHAVHVGARVGGAAGSSEIVVSSTVRDLVGGSGLAFDDLGLHRLKGIRRSGTSTGSPPVTGVRLARSMPAEDDPSYARWSAAIRRELAEVNDGAVVVGHSVGGTIMIHAIAEHSSDQEVAAIVLIAAPFVGDGGWPGDEFQLPGDLGARLPQGVRVHVFHGLEDETVPPAHADLYARAIPPAQVRRLPGGDRQLKSAKTITAREIST